MKSMHILLILTTLSIALPNVAQAQLSPTFYRATCPLLVTLVRISILPAIIREPRMAASLIRLHFHDCFVQGCDASILLNDTATIVSEKNAAPNLDSVRGYEVIDAAKLVVERVCPGIVSCADIVALAAREASTAVGGPTWALKFGRRDSTTADLAGANADLPGPFSTTQELIDAFAIKGLSETDMVALSGAHTIGRARCLFFRGRIYSNGTDIDPAFAAIRRATCPQIGGDNNLAPLDVTTPDFFDNAYYRDLVTRKGLFPSDQVLTSVASTNATVNRYSSNAIAFRIDFANAMIKMSEITPTVLPNGIIRRVCSAIN